MAAFGFGCLLCVAASARAQTDVAFVTRSAEDVEVMQQLARLLDRKVGQRSEPSPRAPAAIMQEAAADWPEPYVVVLDRQGDTVHVLRPRDRTIVSRVLAPELIAESAYAVALATAELLEWLGAAPHARTPERESPAASPGPAPRAPPPEQSAHARSTPSWAVGADLELTSSPGYDVSLVRPSVVGELQLGRGAWPVWLAFGLRGSGRASWEPRLAPGVVAGGVRQVEYSSTDLALHAALGLGDGAAALIAGLVSGLSWVDVEARERRGEVAGDSAEVRGWLGLGVWLRYPIAWGLGLSVGAELHWQPDRARYRVAGAEVLEEGPLRTQTRVGLVWESAFSP